MLKINDLSINNLFLQRLEEHTVCHDFIFVISNKKSKKRKNLKAA